MEFEKFKPGRASTPVVQISLTVSCKNLKDKDVFSKSDPMCVLFMNEFGNSNFIQIGKTEEVQNCLNPEFAHKFVLDYKFEEVQNLKFELYDIDNDSPDLTKQDFLGRLTCTLGEIVGSKGSKIHRKLTGLKGNCGTIIISSEPVGFSREIYTMRWRGKGLDRKDICGSSDPFMQIYRENDDKTSLLIYKTEVCKNTLNPVWNPIVFKSTQFCGENATRPIKFDVYDWNLNGSNVLIGTLVTNLAELKQTIVSQGKLFTLINPKKKGKKQSGQLILTSFAVQTQYCFLEYIRGGMELDFTVAIDLTASNGDPADPDSLHHVHPVLPNQYLISLKAVGEICQDYDTDKMFPALGFGAKLPPFGVVSHNFFLTFDPLRPVCAGINGVIEAYKRTLLSVELFGPTCFAPVINHVSRIASTSLNGRRYFVLLIVTDGIIDDMEDTVDAIVIASYYPLSIIIVGVGEADFTNMTILDADNNVLASRSGMAQRDIVQVVFENSRLLRIILGSGRDTNFRDGFVPMRSYIGVDKGGRFQLCQAKLARDVMLEIPGQVETYMRFRGIKPQPTVLVPSPLLMQSSPMAVCEGIPPLPYKEGYPKVPVVSSLPPAMPKDMILLPKEKPSSCCAACC